MLQARADEAERARRWTTWQISPLVGFGVMHIDKYITS
jgi:hypothetical protein